MINAIPPLEHVEVSYIENSGLIGQMRGVSFGRLIPDTRDTVALLAAAPAGEGPILTLPVTWMDRINLGLDRRQRA